jgi:hypothetical protein
MRTIEKRDACWSVPRKDSREMCLRRPQANFPEPSFTGLVDVLSGFYHNNITFATSGIFI